MDAQTYLQRCQLSVPLTAITQAQHELWKVLEDAKRASLPATPSALNALYTYRVPQLTADGTCSLNEVLAPEPYDLSLALGGRSVGNSLSLISLDSLVELVAEKTRVDWLGLYQARSTPKGRALIKLAFRGAVSRAEFPLTDEFKARSTNVTVALDGAARTLSDVQAHAAAGGAYYECDPKVRSEACIPLVGPTGAVVGVLDAESFTPGFFTDAVLAWLVALALEIPAQLPA